MKGLLEKDCQRKLILEKRKVSVLVYITLYFNEIEQMVDLNLKDFPGSQESGRVIPLSAGCQSPVEPSREMSSSQPYLVRDAARSALANDHSVMNNHFTGKFLLNFSSDNYKASKGINK